MLNTTVSDSRLSLVEIPNDEGEDLFLLNRDPPEERQPLDLRGSKLTLFVEQILRIIDAEDGAGDQGTGKHCETVSYRYRLQDGDATFLRWEYNRERPREDYEYPLAHVHVHGSLEGGRGIERLHIPTARVPLEIILWHLVTEWGVESKSADWQRILIESIEGFHERRTAP